MGAQSEMPLALLCRQLCHHSQSKDLPTKILSASDCAEESEKKRQRFDRVQIRPNAGIQVKGPPAAGPTPNSLPESDLYVMAGTTGRVQSIGS